MASMAIKQAAQNSTFVIKVKAVILALFLVIASGVLSR